MFVSMRKWRVTSLFQSYKWFTSGKDRRGSSVSGESVLFQLGVTVWRDVPVSSSVKQVHFKERIFLSKSQMSILIGRERVPLPFLASIKIYYPNCP